MIPLAASASAPPLDAGLVGAAPVLLAGHLDLTARIWACAEAAQRAERVILKAKSLPAGPPWSKLTDGERVRWYRFANDLLAGIAEVTDAERFAAFVIAASAEALGLRTAPTPRPGLDRLIEAVSRRTHVTFAAIVGTDRHKNTARARHIGMALAHEAGNSYPEIGRAFGNRDHTTVMSAVRKIKARRVTDADLRADYEALRALLGLDKDPGEAPASGERVTAPIEATA